MAFKSPTTPTAPYVDAGLINQNENQGWQTFTFGPYQATQADTILPFYARELMQIKSVSVVARTKPSVASNFNLFARQQGGSDATIANSVSQARNVCAQFDLNTLTDNTVQDLTVTPGTHFTYLQPGDSLVADFATTTSMADLYITVQMRRVRDGFARL